jgi:hypothetical protein
LDVAALLVEILNIPGAIAGKRQATDELPNGTYV